MGVSNVNNSNNINALLLKKPSTAAKQLRKPEYLKMTGSIFNAPQETNTTRAAITELNTQKSIVQLNTSANKKPTASSDMDADKFKNVDNVSDGKEAMSTGKKAKSEVEAQTRQTENDQKTVKNLSNQSQKLGKNIEKNDKRFVQRLKADQNAFDKDNEKLKKLNKETQETQKEIDNAQHELEGLMATNSFSAGGINSDKQARIKELQTLIGSKVTLMQKNGKAIYSLQRSQSKTISRMNKTNKAYINTQKVNKKNIQKQESTNNKIIDVANKIEEISSIVEMGGKAITMGGVALVALGQALMLTLFGGFGAQAMITVGTAMQKVGHVVEMVGKYGQTAANITKTAAYAADGNILGAMQSCAMAVQSGAAAVNSTKNLGNTFKEIDKQATEARQNIAAKEAAKEAVKNMDQKEIQEMGGKKAARKFITADLREQMQNEGVNKYSDMKNFAKNTANLDTAKENATTAYSNANKNARKSLNLAENGNTYTDSKGKIKYVSDNKISRTTNKNFRNTIKEMNAQVSKNTPNMGSLLKDFGSSATNIGMVFLQNKAMGEVSQQIKKPIPQYQMNARTRKILERNHKYANRHII